jgi:hypothetical protein
LRLGTWYLILLGALAIVAMLFAPKGVWGYVAQRYRVALFPVRRMLVRPYERRLIAFLGGDAPPARNELARYPWFRSLLILRMLLGNAFALCIAATETNPERAYHGDP